MAFALGAWESAPSLPVGSLRSLPSEIVTLAPSRCQAATLTVNGYHDCRTEPVGFWTMRRIVYCESHAPAS
eukprot:scaffold30_cov416-Prasinococcus_capsulatus_cf.AAC.23